MTKAVITAHAIKVLVLVSTMSILVVNLGNLAVPGRPVLAIWFLVFCPGLSLYSFFRDDHVSIQATLVIATSVAVVFLSAILLRYAGLWSSGTILSVVSALTLGGLLSSTIHERAIATPWTKHDKPFS